MILEYTFQKAQEIRQQCKTILEAIQFLKTIPETEIIENCKECPDISAVHLLRQHGVVHEVMFLLLYFCTRLGEKNSQFQAISLRLFLDWLFKPIRIGAAEKELTFSSWEAYLAHQSCSNILGWDIIPSLSCTQQCHIYQVQSELVAFLIFLSEAEKRSNLLGIWGKAYAACKCAENDVDPETFAEAAQQYAWILYENYFANPAYGDFPEKANKLFEEAIQYRIQKQSLEIDFHNEICTRHKYFYYLQKLGNISKAEEIVQGLLEKLEAHKSSYESQKSLYYRDYVFCLEAILGIEKYKKEKGKGNRYQDYLTKARKISEELKEAGIPSHLASQYRSLVEMLLQREGVATINGEAQLKALMPKEFFQSREIMNHVLLASTQQNIKLDEIVLSMPVELRRYFMLHDIARRIYRAIFNDYYSNERSTEFFLNTTQFYFKDQREFLYIRENELLWIKEYVLCALPQDKKDDDEQAIYYSILFLASFELTTLIDPSFRESYFEVIGALYRHFTRQGRYDELRKILNLLQKLPWYSQQFRTIKSPQLLASYSAMLQLETLAYQKEPEKFPYQLNLFAIWDNLTVNMEIMSNRVRPFPYGHVFYKWQYIVQTIIWIEKYKRDFAGTANSMDFLLKHVTQKLKNDTGLTARLGEETRTQLFDQLIQSPKPLCFLYEQELESFLQLYHEEGEERCWYYWMTESPIFPSDFPWDNLSGFSTNLRNMLGNYIPHFTAALKELLQSDRAISLSSILWDYDKLNEESRFKLLSTIFYRQDDGVECYTQVTFLSQEDMKGIETTVKGGKNFTTAKIMEHYTKLYKKALVNGKKHLIWIGTELLKFFPIHILPVQSDSLSIWLDTWETIQFSTSLREIRLPQKSYVPTATYPQKTRIPVLRLFGEKNGSRSFPALGKKILDEIVSIESSPVIEGIPKTTEPDCNVQEMRLEYMPEVISYYGHIHYGSYLEESTGFYANGQISNLNHIISSPELGCTKRIDLWGCQGATVFTFDSLELPQYEHFAERFFKIGIEQILATLKEIPDLTAALLWEHMILSEKVTPDASIPVLLKQAIQWYRKAITFVREQVQKAFSEWLKQQKDQHWQEVNKNQPPFLRKILAESINQVRQEFQNSMTIPFRINPFSEEDVGQSMLSQDGACFLSRNTQLSPDIVLRSEQPEEYAKRWIHERFSEYESPSTWGSVIFINTAIASY